jgi:nitrite reductase/ring-hydroxylating ferredoxin subunit
MKRSLTHSILITLLIVSSLIITKSCSSREDTVSCFPQTSINVILNLNLPAYQNLQTVGGWIYVDEQSSGTRGLIVVRTTNGFKVYDRNAPHICPDINTTLNVEANIKIVCPKDNAEWILITGEPTKISQVAPKTYRYSFDSNSGILTIFN